MSIGQYSENGIVVGDCLDVMAGMPDGCVDLILTDPPYNVDFDYRGSYMDKKPNYAAWCKSWFAECQRISRGAVCISCGHVNVAMWCAIEPPNWFLCWWKPAAMTRSPVGFSNWSPMLLYGKSRSRKGCDVVRALIKPDKSLEGHPCPKPLDWGIGFIKLLSLEGDLIFDPFMGSGTTAIAADRLGRRWFGCDTSEEYVAMALERIARDRLGRAQMEMKL